MTNLRSRQSAEDPESQAIRWRVESEARSLNPKEQEQLEQWLNQSDTNTKLFQSADRFCEALDTLSPHALEDLLPEQDLRLQPGMSASATHGARFRPWWQRAAVAAVVAGLIAGAVMMIGIPPAPDYATGLGETRSVTLPDGSVLEMNTKTSVRIEQLPDVRRVTLLGGEAYFQVASDANRPFEVQLPHGKVRALGTAFNINIQDSSVTVAVQEHAVRVTTDEPSRSQDVAAGQKLAVSDGGHVGPVEPLNEVYELAWRRHRLIFENRPLLEVIRELNRYRPGYIIPVDIRLANMTLTAIFDTRRLDEALHTLQSALPITMIRFTDRLVLVYRSSAS